MKNHIIISIAIATLVLSSCSGFLDTTPTDAISTSSMWTSEDKADAGMAGLYYPLYKTKLTRTQIRMEDYDGLNRTGIEGIGFTSDEYSSNYPLTYLSRSTKISGDFQVRLEWKIIYTVVHACNDAIANLSKAGLDTAKYERYQCEARLLRAWAYSRLNMLYGGVPVYLEPVTNDECTRVQSSFSEVWQVVIDDCTYAIENEYCPDNTLTSNYGRPSKGLAYALRGMAYMWLAANKEPVIDASSTGLSDDEIKDYYEDAASDFEEVEKCGYGLWNGTWGDFFCEANEKDKEMIFPLQFTTDVGYCHNWQQVIGATDNYIGWQQLTPDADFVNSYENADGTDFKWSEVPGMEDWDGLSVQEREVYFLRDSLQDIEADIADFDARIAAATTDDEKDYLNTRKNYKTTLKTNRDEAIKRIGQDVYDKYYLNIGNEARLKKAYDDRDPRLKQAVITPYEEVNSYSPYNEPLRVLTKQLRWPFAGQDLTTDGADLWPNRRSSFFYIWKKYNVLDASLPGGTAGRQRCGYDWPLVRYTQVLLERAEALCQIDRLSEAKDLVDQIRSRAGMPGIALGTKEEMLAQIRYESRVELCEEGVDYFNEIRWGTYKETKFQGEDINRGKNCWGDGQYEYAWYYTDYMWPWSIPDWESQKNTNLKRRDGWLY
ncbi:MAG: RagB/SusD family nutrient uptake outer membrane protein [Bacteroidales bacterium]|nr:RagB/SusD family nutrient uptake outer membrane protein [Bacteroidales bacterium]MCI2121531.1 RagB/SusD family nutrient uptake outer membrane protein [Bacteroidales bacterium]MCI2145527.1 RagB/SusD family nutrient uptake outer membrane protein [Bacteroidales bacterium]